MREDALPYSLADLHIHSYYSDGAHSPEEVLRRAKLAGITIASITDHDNVAGVDEALDYGRALGIEVVPGIELSVTIGSKDIHLLAYFFDHRNAELLEFLTFVRTQRYHRAQRMVKKLNDLHLAVSFDAVLNEAGIGSIGRPHIANALVKGGFIESYYDAFERYIGNNGPAFETKYIVEPEYAIRLMSKAGGLVFLAHPGKYTREFELSTLIRAGIDGIEIVHPSHTAALETHYKGIANQYFLLESGGSDFHGGLKGDDAALGKYTVGADFVEKMKTRLFRLQQ